MRRAKIVCTIGPACRTEEKIRELIEAGMNVARLNFSHGTHAEHEAVMRTIRHQAHLLNRNIAILLDLSGPKIRLGMLRETIMLKAGEIIELTTEPIIGEGLILPVQYEHLLEEVHPGDRISMSDGLILLEIREVSKTCARALVLSNGPISSHKGINLPMGGQSIPALTDKDAEDLRFGLRAGVDWVALSFVRSPDDARGPKAIMEELGVRVPLLAKIEKRRALDRIHGIMLAFDGLMVARGDLGVEAELEDVPAIQKMLINAANKANKPVITATQMLLSMVKSPRPTRAEVSDVANAILDGTDAVMLSEETAVGEDPAHVVRTMATIVDRAEAMARARGIDFRERRRSDAEMSRITTPNAIARATGYIAGLTKAALIITPTESGSTARLISAQRPSVPILALTNRPGVVRALELSWGVVAREVPPFESMENVMQICRKMALESGLAKPGDRAVVTAGLPVNQPGTTNLLEVIEL